MKSLEKNAWLRLDPQEKFPLQYECIFIEQASMRFFSYFKGYWRRRTLKNKLFQQVNEGVRIKKHVKLGVGMVLYVLCYKGKCLGKPMELSDAEASLKQMSRCFNGLEIVPWHQGNSAETASGQQKLG